MQYFQVYKDKQGKRIIFALPELQSFLGVPKTPEIEDLQKKNKIVKIVTHTISYLSLFGSFLFFFYFAKLSKEGLSVSDPPLFILFIPAALLIAEGMFQFADHYNKEELSAYQPGTGYHENELSYILHEGKKQFVKNKLIYFFILFFIIFYILILKIYLCMALLLIPIWYNFRILKIRETSTFFKNIR